jgi:uncharacterized protein (TIGR03437 family)
VPLGFTSNGATGFANGNAYVIGNGNGAVVNLQTLQVTPSTTFRNFSAIQFDGGGSYFYGVGSNILFTVNTATGTILNTTQYNLGNSGFTNLWTTDNSDGTVTVDMLGPTGVVVTTITPPITHPTPTISAVVNSFSYQPGPATGGSIGTISPNEWISPFGTGLAVAATTATTTPFPTTLNGTTTWMQCLGQSPFALQASYVSGGQVNVFVPASLSPSTCPTVSLWVAVAFADGTSASSAPVQLSVAASAPGLLQNSAGFAWVVHLDGTVNTSAMAGETIIQFGVGFGATNPPDASGLQVTTVTPLVTINGVPADVAFSGLCPGFVGLYQFNVVVPNIGDGPQSIVSTVGGGTAARAQINIGLQP